MEKLKIWSFVIVLISLISFIQFTNAGIYSDCNIYGTCTITNSSTASPSSSSFLGLSDTPSSYTGSGSDCVKVNVGETGLVFGACSTALAGVSALFTGNGFIDLNDSTGAVELTFDTGGLNTTITNANTTLKNWIDAQNYLTSYTETDPKWTANYSLYNGTWSSITNTSYYLVSNPNNYESNSTIGIYNNSLYNWIVAQGYTAGGITWANAVNGTLMSQANYNTNYTGIIGSISDANTSAVNYADAQDIVFNNSIKSYVDAQDTTFNTSIKNYADANFVKNDSNVVFNNVTSDGGFNSTGIVYMQLGQRVCWGNSTYPCWAWTEVNSTGRYDWGGGI